ncbi:MAG: glycosyltransferase family 2 protein [Candidatus Hydrothermarchaeota archaeon]|nr:glycosyltransferase family 2 protein [Candidatus Hydrothermarchaeota archaeon]
MKKVSIIILNWNGKELTKNCLNSIRERTEYPDYEVIVVDNGSTDGSVEMLEREFPEVKLIKNDRNLGFGRGNNQGMEIAQGEYFFLLNNDTLVTRGWLTNAVEIMESDNRIASVGSTLIPPSEVGQVEYIQRGKDRQRDTVCGAAMLMKRKAAKRIGMFDVENFSPIYGEETDWHYRARALGYTVIETKKSVVVHIGSVATKKQNPNQYLLLNTHRLKAMLYNDSPVSFLKRIPGLGLVFIHSINERMTMLLLKSYWNNIKNWRNILKERKKRKEIARRLREEQERVGEEWF